MPRLGVIFDLDGTLIKFPEPWIREARREYLDWLLKNFTVDSKTIEELAIPQIIELVANGDHAKYRNLREVANAVYMKRELEAAENAVVREGVVELLEELRRRGVSLSVATNNCRDAAVLSLERADIKGFFDCVVSRSDVEQMKPSPEMLLKAAYATNIPIGMGIHVGDSVVDVLAARSIGMMSVSITGGVTSREKLLSSKPHFIIEHPLQLLEILK
ncbi:MAG: HAD family hydrolase [Aigarchaeota archaeon]|nr:HAD family hydrolase [Candidatus Calditenuaceae archaeon]